MGVFFGVGGVGLLGWGCHPGLVWWLCWFIVLTDWLTYYYCITTTAPKQVEWKKIVNMVEKGEKKLEDIARLTKATQELVSARVPA